MVPRTAAPVPAVVAYVAADALFLLPTANLPPKPLLPVLYPATAGPVPLVKPYIAMAELPASVMPAWRARPVPLSVMVNAVELPLYVRVTGGLSVGAGGTGDGGKVQPFSA